MSIFTPLITAEQLFELAGGDTRSELIRGELKQLTPAGYEHGVIVARLTWRLAQHVEQHKLGEVSGAETGFILSRKPDTVRAADIAFVRAERIAAEGVPQKFFPGAPDLAVEVVSPGDVRAEVMSKVQSWHEGGARLVWVVWPQTRAITIHRSGVDPMTLRETDELLAPELLPGFRCAVAGLFAKR